MKPKSSDKLTGNGEAFNGVVPGLPEPENNITFSEGKKCPHCNSAVPDKPANKSYCSNRCRDDYFNNLKKEKRQKLEQLELKTAIQVEENNLNDVKHHSLEIRKQKADIKLQLQGLEIPEEGLVVGVEYLNKLGIDLSLYDKKVELRNHPGHFMVEFSDYGCFWVAPYKILIANKINYITWL